MPALLNQIQCLLTTCRFGRVSILTGLAIFLLSGCELEALNCTGTSQVGGTVSITAPYNWSDLDGDSTNGTVFLAVQTPTDWTAGAAQFNATSDDGLTPNSGPVSPATQNPTDPPPLDNSACFQNPPPSGFSTTFYTIGPLVVGDSDTGTLTASFTAGNDSGPVPVSIGIAFQGNVFQDTELQCGNIEQCTVNIAAAVPATIPTLDSVGLILLILGLCAVLVGARLRKS